MHPVVGIVSFVVFAAALSFGAAPQLALGAVLLAVFTLLSGVSVSAGLRMVWRLRWLLVSILVVYLWFTPGAPLVAGWEAAWLPTREGLLGGAVRVGVLVLIVLAVAVLGERIPRERLLGALYWMSTPLAPLGLARERLLLRLILTLEAAPVLQAELAARYRERRAQGSRLGAAAATAADAFDTIIRRAESAPCPVRVVQVLEAPPLWQWLYPLALALAFWVAGRLL